MDSGGGHTFSMLLVAAVLIALVLLVHFSSIAQQNVAVLHGSGSPRTIPARSLLGAGHVGAERGVVLAQCPQR